MVVEAGGRRQPHSDQGPAGWPLKAGSGWVFRGCAAATTTMAGNDFFLAALLSEAVFRRLVSRLLRLLSFEDL